MSTTTQVMSEYKFIKDYSQWREEDNRYETWEEAVERVMDMHKTKFADKYNGSVRLQELFDYATTEYKAKNVLGSQRSLQFGGSPTLRKNERIFNCLTSYCDRPRFFQEAMHWLLCGGGVGFSAQTHHIEKLPTLTTRTNGVKTFIIEDSIEGWADSFGVLLSSFLTEDATFPEYTGNRVDFDFSLIRPEGALISGGYKAPGPDGLRQALFKVTELLEKAAVAGRKLKPIECYDFVMHMSDAVLSGGVRRSATICIFSKEDAEMMSAKTGDWFIKNPQRGRSNNSALLIRDDTSKEEFLEMFRSVEQFGEPGIVWADNKDVVYNPLNVAA